MAGMNGFSHNCSSLKVKYTDFKGSLKDSAFDDADVSLIWDFYVTHAFSGGSGQEIEKMKFGGGSGTENKIPFQTYSKCVCTREYLLF